MTATDDSDSQLLQVGDTAPDFELPDGSGNSIRLSRELERHSVVIYFVRAFT